MGLALEKIYATRVFFVERGRVQGASMNVGTKPVFSNYGMVIPPWLSGMGETKRGGFVFYLNKLVFIVFCTSWRILFIFDSFSANCFTLVLCK
jgi:hypothetical protein